MSRLKIGVCGQMFLPAENAVASISRAERAGWDFINYPDQLTGTHPTGLLQTPVLASDPSAPTGMYSDIWLGSFEMCTAAAVLTERMEIMLAVVDPLRRSPALMAQELATINLLSKGRFTVALGSGEAKQFEPYGERRIKPMARLEEAIRTYRALWSSGGEPISRDSEFWPLSDAVFPLARHEWPDPQLLMVGGTEQLLALTGELCDGWLTFLPGGVMDDPDMLAAVIGAVKAAAERHGRDPESLRFVGQVFSSIAETDDRAMELARLAPVAWLGVVGASIAGGIAWKKWGYEHPFGDFNWSKDMNINLVDEQRARELAAAVPDEILEHSCIIGSPERVAARLQPFIDAGINELSLFNFANAGDPEHAASWEVLASDVRQRLGCAPLTVTPA